MSKPFTIIQKNGSTAASKVVGRVKTYNRNIDG